MSTVYCDSFSLIWRPDELCDPDIAALEWALAGKKIAVTETQPTAAM